MRKRYEEDLSHHTRALERLREENERLRQRVNIEKDGREPIERTRSRMKVLGRMVEERVEVRCRRARSSTHLNDIHSHMR